MIYHVSDTLNIIISDDPKESPFALLDTTTSPATLTLPREQAHRKPWETDCVIVVESAYLVSLCTRQQSGATNHYMHTSRWFHYHLIGGQWVRATWRQLSLEEQDQILRCYACGPALPAPGKSASEKATPGARTKAQALTTYKIVGMDHHGQLRSIFAPRLIYTIGLTQHESAKPNHRGGFYSFTDLDALMNAWRADILFPSARGRFHRFAVLECQAWGREIVYDRGMHAGGLKIGTTYLKPLRVLHYITMGETLAEQAS